MIFPFLVMRTPSVPVIIEMNFQTSYVLAIYFGPEAIRWYDETLTQARRV